MIDAHDFRNSAPRSPIKSEGIDTLIEVDKSSSRLYDEIATPQFLLLNNPASRINPEKLQSVSRLRKYRPIAKR
jgi:hypothetical protein